MWSVEGAAMNAPETVFPAGPVETDKTGETDLVSNADFLAGVFTTIPEGAFPAVCCKPGNPGIGGWKAQRAGDATAQCPAGHNNFVGCSTFYPLDDGSFRARKSQFAACHFLMLDDIGTKVPFDRLSGFALSWLIETSPGNHQGGIILAEPITDGAVATRLLNAIIEAGLCDPGATGPLSRWARLPVGINGKPKHVNESGVPFRSRLAEWRPELRRAPEEIVEGLQLELAPAGRPKKAMKADGTTVRNLGNEADDVLIPKAAENPVVTALKASGLYKTPLGSGKHDITCPWVHEHTDAVDGGAAYFEPDELYPMGGFCCQHSHRDNYHVRALLEFLGVPATEARHRPMIRVVAGEMHRVVDAAEQELAQSRRHYQRGGLIVTVSTDPGTRETRVQEVTLPALVRALANAATWERFDGRAQDWVRADPPARHAGVLFDDTSYRHLPVLNGLTRQPYLRPDGSLMTTAGYDLATGMFGVFDARTFSIPELPTREQAEAALAVLKDLLTEFSFASENDLAAALSAIVTAAVRPSLNVAPMFHARAHMVGSGKSYLCELITAFATPQRGTPTTFPADDEECRKLLLAELLRAPAVIEFDNLTGDLVAHKSLCTALTSEFMSGRILGVSKTATVSTRALFLSSGNNVGPVQDMTRRCITIHLSPQCEVPAARTFTRPDLVREVLRERGRYVSSALTLVRAWIVAGRPKTPCKSLASFGDWSDLCRQPLLWLGLPDPTASVFVAMAEDPDRETLNRLMESWEHCFGTAPTMVRDLVKGSDSFDGRDEELREVLRDIAAERGSDINRRRLGWWIRRHSGRIVDGRRIVRVTGNSSAEKWRIEVVESVSPVSSVSVPPTEKDVSNDRHAYARASRGE